MRCPTTASCGQERHTAEGRFAGVDRGKRANGMGKATPWPRPFSSTRADSVRLPRPTVAGTGWQAVPTTLRPLPRHSRNSPAPSPRSKRGWRADGSVGLQQDAWRVAGGGWRMAGQEKRVRLAAAAHSSNVSVSPTRKLASHWQNNGETVTKLSWQTICKPVRRVGTPDLTVNEEIDLETCKVL